MLYKVITEPGLYVPLDSSRSESIKFKSAITMPKQGPGTKLVLKGLKLALPDIAERYERDLDERNSRRRHSNVRDLRKR